MIGKGENAASSPFPTVFSEAVFHRPEEKNCMVFCEIFNAALESTIFDWSIESIFTLIIDVDICHRKGRKLCWKRRRSWLHCLPFPQGLQFLFDSPWLGHRIVVNLFHMTNFRLLQTERDCKWQFRVWWKWWKVFQKGTKHCGKRRNCLLWAISPFPTVFSKDLAEKWTNALKRLLFFSPTGRKSASLWHGPLSVRVSVPPSVR